MGFFGKLWTRIRGIFIRSGNDAVSSSPEAIRSAYAAAIDEAKRRYKELERVVALLAGEREKTEMIIKDLEKQRSEFDKKLEGALAQAESDPNNVAHRDAGTRFLSLIEEIDRKQAKLREDLEFQKNKVEEYKLKLRSSTSEIEKLKREQSEMVAEFVSNQQLLRMEDRLRGLSDSSVDESVVAIREKVAAMREQAKMASEMRGATLESQDEVYARLGDEKKAATRFDELLKARSAAKAGAETKDRDLG
jgi:phage shock protein A